MIRLVLPAALAASIAVLAVGCGDEEAPEGNGGTIVRGTTDEPISYDPAGAYDLPSYDGIYAMYQNLLTIPPGDNTPVPEAAERCEFTNRSNTTLRCRIRPGLKFTDGSDLTAEDVAFSFERNVGIDDPNGASSLLANMRTVEASKDDRIVTFELEEPDATWPLVLTAASFAIVPSDVYPADELQPNDEVVGSGRYALARFAPGRETVLEKNDSYQGDAPARNDRVVIRYYGSSARLAEAIESGEVDVAYRGLSPDDIEALEEADGVEVVAGTGTEIRYLAFNLALQPGSTDEEKLAVRQALAQVIDRAAIAEDVYKGTVKPLYSMVPQGVEYATEAFAERYGADPDPAGAERTLSRAGVEAPVPLELWWTPEHYGPASEEEFEEIERQLEEGGLFDVTLRSRGWKRYVEEGVTDRYPVFQRGWFPDYPDADDYTAPFFAADSFLNTHYDNPEMEELLTEEKASEAPAVREKTFAGIQQIAAEDAPMIPLWQADQVAAVGEGIEGVAETFDSSFIFRYWLVTED